MKTRNYILTFSLLLGLMACQKLDREFVTTLSRNQIEVSYGNVRTLLTVLYSDLPDGMLYINGNAMLASASDEAEYTNETNPVQAFNTGSWNAISNPDAAWPTYYRTIRRANQFLLSTDNINLDQYRLDPAPAQQLLYNTYLAEIKRWKYEARFLRAFYYFELVKRYGGVPLLKEALPIEEDFSTIKRNSLSECIQFISDECDSAAAQLPLNGSTAPYIQSTDLGRATKLAALSLKSRVLLYAASDLFNTTSWAGGYSNAELISLPAGNRANRWKAASDAAKAVIDAAALPTLGAYKSLFNTYNNGEIIWSRINAASGNSNLFERINAPIGFPQAQGGNAPSQDLVDAYEIKADANTAIPFNWNNPAHAASPYATSGALARDPRLFASIVVNNAAYGTPSRNVQSWNSGLDGKPLPNASKTGYYLRKYVQESLNITQNNTAAHSWIFFRYPEIYLNYAEALNEWSPGNADIKIYYDRVRNRTGVAMPPLPAGLSQSAVRDKIRNERRVELAFEEHRFWDVRRWMLGTTVFNAPLRGVNITLTAPSTFTYVPFTVENRVFQPKMYLYPIPQTDLNISPLLVQNPQW
jgi:starch-binding outer membrane protein, SusD/RagB family